MFRLAQISCSLSAAALAPVYRDPAHLRGADKARHRHPTQPRPRPVAAVAHFALAAH